VHRPGLCAGRYPDWYAGHCRGAYSAQHRSWYAGHCRGARTAQHRGWCAAHCPGAHTAHHRGWYGGHCPRACWDRRDPAVSRARPAARAGPNRDRSGWANRPTWHRVTCPPAGMPGAHPGRTLARSPRPGSSRFLARSRPAAAAPVPPAAWVRNPPAAWARNPPAAWARNPPAAWAGNGAAWARSRTQRPLGHAACGAPPKASGPGQRSTSAAGRVLQFADRAACQVVGQATGQRPDPGGSARDRHRSGRTGHPAGRAVPATHLTVAGSRPAGRSADRHPSAVDHLLRRRADRYARASVHAAGRLPDHVRPAADHSRGAGAAVDHPAGHPAVCWPGTAVGRSTPHRAVPRPAAAADQARNRSRRAAPEPDTDYRRAHAAGASRAGASLRSACCALSPGQREITTSCGTQAFPRRHSSPPAAIGQPRRPGQVPARWSQRAGR
jgi:hypothetical protein